MNEKLQYAEMLEIPISTCNITYKPTKKRLFSKKKKINTERVKEQVIDKVNNGQEELVQNEQSPQALYQRAIDLDGQTVSEVAVQDNLDAQAQGQITDQISPDQIQLERLQPERSQTTQTAVISSKRKKRKFSFVGLQVAVIVALLGVISVTNALNSNSGINVFLKGVFGMNATQSVDMREYDDFSPVISMQNGTTTLENGVITISGEGSVYSPCDGKITSVTKTEAGTYDVEIYHSENFKTVFNGLQYVYAEVGSQVYSNIPVGYSAQGDVKMCFFENDGNVITDFTLNGSNVVWA